MCDKFTEEYVEKRLINRIGVLILVLTSRRSEANQEKYMSDAIFACNGLKPCRNASSAPSA